MKLSDYLAQALAQYSVSTVFGYQGSSISHLIDSLSRHPELRFVETRHEQAAAFAANGFALAGNGMGVALSCSGPGATNLLSGIADAYYDSLPCLFLTGQVSVREMKTDSQMRQLGFQETDVVSLVKPITKYAVTVLQPDRIAYELEQAVYWMQEGRPGPVLIDIPHNVQGSDIDPQALEHYKPLLKDSSPQASDLTSAAAQIAAQLQHSRRPVILLGGGSRSLKQDPAFEKFLAGLEVPVVSSYRGKDVLDNHLPCYCGTLGVYGDRCANWAVRYCDFLLVLGSRLDGRQTGDGQEALAPEAQVAVVDLDPVELRNMPSRFQKVTGDVPAFVAALAPQLSGYLGAGDWLEVVRRWRRRYPDEQEYRIPEGANPNLLLKALSARAQADAVFAVDVGQNQLWANTSLCLGRDQYLLQSCGLGSMGFALPAAIGGYFCHGGQPVCICGDGGFQMNLQELQTAACYDIPIKVLVFNNSSLGLIRIYQDKALGGRHFGSVSGFGSPDYRLLAQAYGMAYVRIDNNDFEQALAQAMDQPGGCLIEVVVSADSTNDPEPTYLSTIDNQSRELSPEEKQRVREEAYGIPDKE